MSRELEAKCSVASDLCDQRLQCVLTVSTVKLELAK